MQTRVSWAQQAKTFAAQWTYKFNTSGIAATITSTIENIRERYAGDMVFRFWQGIYRLYAPHELVLELDMQRLTLDLC